MDPSPRHGGVLKGQFTKAVPLIRGQGRLVYGLPLFPVCFPGTLPGPPYHNHLAARGKRRAGKALAEFMVPAASLASSEVLPVFVWDFLRAHANFLSDRKKGEVCPHVQALMFAQWKIMRSSSAATVGSLRNECGALYRSGLTPRALLESLGKPRKSMLLCQQITRPGCVDQPRAT